MKRNNKNLIEYAINNKKINVHPLLKQFLKEKNVYDQFIDSLVSHLYKYTKSLRDINVYTSDINLLISLREGNKDIINTAFTWAQASYKYPNISWAIVHDEWANFSWFSLILSEYKHTVGNLFTNTEQKAKKIDIKEEFFILEEDENNYIHF